VTHEMLVLNGAERAQRDKAFFTRTVTSSIDIPTQSAEKKKKLSASNVKFLQSLGFKVRNFF
jgi:hypothetical protein